MAIKVSEETIAAAGPADAGDAREIAGLLSNESLQRALCSVLQEADERDRLSMVDLTEGLESAHRRQGVVEGLRRAVSIIVESADNE